MKEAVIFNGYSSLDFLEVRQSVLRIPEVTMRLRELQKLWDKFGPGPLDVVNYVGSDDQTFFSSLSLKQFLVSVVQVGLYDRHKKRSELPAMLVGIVSSDSALTVCTGQKTLEEFTLEFLARVSHQTSVVGSEDKITENADETPQLSGSGFDQFGVVDVIPGPGFVTRPLGSMTMPQIVQELVDVDDVSRFVHIGPGRSFFAQIHKDFALRDVEFIESIEIDPMLNWFWPSVREASQASTGPMMM